jgi:hypothetical protein
VRWQPGSAQTTPVERGWCVGGERGAGFVALVASGGAPFAIGLGIEPVDERDPADRWKGSSEAEHPELVLPVHELPGRVLFRMQRLGIDPLDSSFPCGVLDRPQPDP